MTREDIATERALKMHEYGQLKVRHYAPGGWEKQLEDARSTGLTRKSSSLLALITSI